MQPARAVDLTIDGRRISAVETNQGPIRADVVLDASGSNKFVSRFFSTRWHQHSRQLTARYGYVDRPQQRAGTSPNPFISYDECGWTWIAQIDLNSCAWVHLRFDGRDPGQDWIPLELRAFGNHLPSRGADVTWRIAEQLAGDNWFLLGDAAAILDPSSGHGALRAMMSGIHAAHLVGGTLSGSILSTDAALAYDSWLRAWFESDMHQLRKLADAPDVTAPHPPFEWSNLNLDAGRIELPGIQKPAAG